MLSDKDIYRELVKAKNLAIYPLKLGNINGSSVNFTASANAWYVSNGKTAVNENKISLPPGETVSILTEESLCVSNKISGTYHSRVSLSAKGLSNISTTLDPNWSGFSIISLTNNSIYKQTIDVGTGIVTLTFDYLHKKAHKSVLSIAPSRSDIYSQFQLNSKQREMLDSTEHKNPDSIRKNMKNSEAYKSLIRLTFRSRMIRFFTHPFVTLVLGGILVAVVEYFLGVLKSN